MRSAVESSAIVPCPPAQVWSVLEDFDSRPKFIPGMKEVRIVRVEGNHVWLAERLRVLFSSIRYQVIGTLEPERGVMSWVLDKSAEHDIADTRGAWQLVPLVDGTQTLVQYRTWVDSGRPVPRFIEQFLIKRSLPKIVAGLRSEVQRRFQP